VFLTVFDDSAIVKTYGEDDYTGKDSSEIIEG
jgi:hypothetical protein